MNTQLYKQLARHLDELPGGFPPTDSGVELRILKRLFTPDEAAFALHLTLIPEEVSTIARRAKMPAEIARERLEEMAMKGLIYRLGSNKQFLRYMAAQFVIGIWEFHVNDLDPDLIRDVNEYIPTLFKEAWKSPQLRTVPVNTSLNPDIRILSYENIDELVHQAGPAVVAPCICRREKSIMAEGCDRPEEACLVFGRAAQYYRHNGLGRAIEMEEVFDIIKMADEKGLVLQPGNSKKILNICCCCGCCCGILRTLRQMPRPAELVSSPFVATFDPEECQQCGVCQERCQMMAFKETDTGVQYDPSRCIGCGLCVSTCPTDALQLVRKPEAEQPVVPEDSIAAGLALGRARGKLKTTELVMMQIKSKVDRLLAKPS